MDVQRFLALIACGLLIMVSPQQAAASGTLLEIGPDDFCLNQTPQRVTFSPPPFTYVFGGTCNMIHTRLQVPVDVPWTGTGTYDPATGKVTEDINVPPPAINQPSRPFGRFMASMHCPADPWLDPNVKCDQVTASSNPPPTAYPPNTYGDYSRALVSQILGNIRGYGRPYTAGMNDKQRQYLTAQYQTYAAAMKKQEQLQQGARQSSSASGAYSALLHPSVLSPTSGQILYSQSAVSIKLGPPQGWTVTGYTINIQRRDANGTWVNHTTIPIAAATAHSPGGYTGFGGGAPPAFLMLPGKWRLNAQASSPKISGVSDWVEFNAIFTSDSTTLKKKRLY